jgi:hypothetical protein
VSSPAQVNRCFAGPHYGETRVTETT